MDIFGWIDQDAVGQSSWALVRFTGNGLVKRVRKAEGRLVKSEMRAWWNGRHARLRIWYRKVWRFKSSRAHQIAKLIDGKKVG